jgi:glucose uptake protein
MLLPHRFPVALAMMVAGMLCWGSWTNAHRIAHKWRVELFHWDYSFGIVLICLSAAATAGTFFGSPTFGENLLGADRTALLWAAAGGVCLNAGSLTLMVGISRVGMAVAFPIAVGLALVMGTLLSYMITPKGDPRLLGLGVALCLAAVLTNSIAYRYRTAEDKAGRGSMSALGICVVAGIFFTCSGPMVAKALASPKPLAPYGACVMFALGSLITAVPLLRYFMRRPIEGPPVTMTDYFAGSLRNHAAGLLGGCIWGGGMLFTFVAAGTAGMAIALAIGQANPLVAALWGVFVWKEFQGAPPRARSLLALMFALYIGGLISISLSYNG